MSSPLATVGILSIGEMGLGIAKLLIGNGYRVVTNITGRSDDTHTRARKGKIETLSSDTELVSISDYIISIVPPRDAQSTAQRIITALNSSESPRRETPLYFLDLNAISPRSARGIAELFIASASPVRFIDGGIIGGPPSRKDDTSATNTVTSHPESGSDWNRPSIPVSGPHLLSDAPNAGAHLASTLNVRHLSEAIGPASGLKMCFATTTKGFTALAVQAFATAQSLGVLEELQKEMGERIPATLKTAERGVVSMAPKAYRWVREMEEIADTHAEDGGFEKEIFAGIADVYRLVAEETVLGGETTERRKRGRTVEDMAVAVGEGLEAKRKKKD